MKSNDINKKSEWKRVGIFFLLSYGIFWAHVIIMSKVAGSYENWNNKNIYICICAFFMFSPAVANVLTRIITKEGFHNSYLHLHLKGNIKYYLLAVAVPFISGILSGLMFTLFFGKFSIKEISENNSLLSITGYTFYILSSGLIFSFVTFGEEFGWRAYLYPKLEKLLNAPAAAIIGGIIWGLWHAPLTAIGHNFGKDYWGFPYTGILLMTVLCTSEGIFLMILTKKTGSVYPAAIWHGLNNQGASYIGNMLISGFDMNQTYELRHHIVIAIPNIILGIVSFIIICRMSKKEKS